MVIRAPVLTIFPKMIAKDCEQTSPIDRFYNCIGHAAGRRVFWWPFPGPPHTFWPPAAPQSLSVEAFEAAFATLGYAPCDSDALDPDAEKIALFVDGGNPPCVTHAARQLPNGEWTSKLGKLEDIRHPLRQVEGRDPAYGTVASFMSRPRPAPASPPAAQADPVTKPA